MLLWIMLIARLESIVQITLRPFSECLTPFFYLGLLLAPISDMLFEGIGKLGFNRQKTGIIDLRKRGKGCAVSTNYSGSTTDYFALFRPP
jgi:hypothetical protein